MSPTSLVTTEQLTPRIRPILLAGIGLAGLLGVGPSLEAVAFTAFGCALVLAVREESTRETSDALAGAWLAATAMVLLAIGIMTGDLDWSIRPFAAAAAFGGAAGTIHLLHPAGFCRREVLLSAFVAFGLGFAGWTTLIAVFVMAALATGVIAAVRIVRGPVGAGATVDYTAVLAVIAIVAIPFL